MRDANIDALKGIGILCVMAGHVLAWGSLPSKCLFAFHVPLFFFIAGAFDKTAGLGFGDVCRRIFSRCVVPYFFFSAIGVCTLPVRPDVAWNAELLKSVFWNFHPAMNGPAWFLAVLAMVQLASWLQNKFWGTDPARGVGAMVAALGIGCMIAAMPVAWIRQLPFKLGAFFFGFALHGAGKLAGRGVPSFLAERRLGRDIPCLAVFVLLLVLLAKSSPPAHAGIPLVKSPAFFPACAAGILAALHAVRTFQLGNVRPLAWIGENSLHFFCLDYVALPFVVQAFDALFPSLAVGWPVLSHGHGHGTALALFALNLLAVAGLVVLVKPLYRAVAGLVPRAGRIQ